MEERRISLSLNLVYREISGEYYVTVPEQRKVIVLNRPAFTVLQLCHDQTISSLRSMIAKGDPEIDTVELSNFLCQLEDHGLVVIKDKNPCADSHQKEN